MDWLHADVVHAGLDDGFWKDLSFIFDEEFGLEASKFEGVDVWVPKPTGTKWILSSYYGKGYMDWSTKNDQEIVAAKYGQRSLPSLHDGGKKLCDGERSQSGGCQSINITNSNSSAPTCLTADNVVAFTGDDITPRNNPRPVLNTRALDDWPDSLDGA